MKQKNAFIKLIQSENYGGKNVICPLNVKMAESLECNFENPSSAIEKEIAELSPWFHNLHLPGGIQTAPNHKLGDFPNFNWERIAPYLPANIKGMSVLDIGCNAGFYSFELAKLGAEVTAIDSNEHYLRQAKWGAKKLGVEKNITFIKMQLYDLINMEERFDIIFFLGVFYHLRYPLLGLDIAASKTNKYMIFQALTLPGNENVQETPFDIDYDERDLLNKNYWPRMAFVEKMLAGDPTNWWVPNIACVEAMLRSCGLKIKHRIFREFYVCEPGETYPGSHQANLKFKIKQ